MAGYSRVQGRNEKSKRLVVDLPEDEFDQIDGWGIPAGMPSRKEAVRHLLKKGLEAVADATS